MGMEEWAGGLQQGIRMGRGWSGVTRSITLMRVVGWDVHRSLWGSASRPRVGRMAEAVLLLFKAVYVGSCRVFCSLLQF